MLTKQGHVLHALCKLQLSNLSLTNLTAHRMRIYTELQKLGLVQVLPADDVFNSQVFALTNEGINLMIAIETAIQTALVQQERRLTVQNG